MSELVLNVESASGDQLETLVALVKHVRGIPGDIVEIGAWKCGTTVHLADADWQKTVYAFDLFGGMPYPDTTEFQNFADVDFESIKQLVSNLPNIMLVRGRHEETIPLFARYRRPISLLYMDSDWYSSHMVALEHLAPLVSANGLIVFHDWQFPMVQQAAVDILTESQWEPLAGYEFNPPERPMQVLRKCHS